MEAKISIIIPAYNIENYVGPCLDSVLAQTYGNLEILIINDGSTDKTPIILDEYAGRDSRIKVVHQENGGVTRARLRGVAEATGEWIGFVDGDDYVEPEMFERLLDNAVRYGADISHCGYRMVLPERVDYYYNTGRLVSQESQEALKELLAGTFEPGLVNKIFRRELFYSLLEQNVMDCSIKINEDLLMNFYLFRAAGQTVFEDVCPYHYMVRKGSAATSKSSINNLLDPVKVRKKLLTETEGNEELHSLARQSLIRQLVHIASMPVRKQPDDIRTYIAEARQDLRRELAALRMDPYAPKKLQVQGLWAAIWPASYGMIHSIYGEISGATHKYDV